MDELLEGLREGTGFYVVDLVTGGQVVIDLKRAWWGTDVLPFALEDKNGRFFLWQAFITISKVDS